MKVILSWITDPCVHLIVIGLVLTRLMMGMSPEPEPEDLANIAPKCQVCDKAHDFAANCPVLASARNVRQAAN